jgi:hypothetical protein
MTLKLITKALQGPYFILATRKGNRINVMSLIRDEMAEHAFAQHAKATEAYAKAVADNEALPEEERGAVLLQSPPEIPAAFKPLEGDDLDDALDAIDVDRLNPGFLLAGAAIGAAGGGLWRAVQWDHYEHGSANLGSTGDNVHQWVLTIDTDGYIYAPYDRIAEWRPGDSGSSDLKRLERSIVLSVTSATPDAALDDCVIHLNANGDVGHSTNIDGLEPVLADQAAEMIGRHGYPVIKLTAPAKMTQEDAVEIEIAVTIGGKEPTSAVPVDLVADIGYLAARKVHVSTPIKVKFRALDLDAGQVAAITASVRNTSTKTTHITVESGATT